MHRSCINDSDDRTQIYGGQVFLDPPDRSTFSGGGGGGGVQRSHTDLRSKEKHVDQWLKVFFGPPPPTDLLLTVGGGGLEWNCTMAGPLSIRGMNLLVPNPTASYCMTYLVAS
jgi:hypothetical protein